LIAVLSFGKKAILMRPKLPFCLPVGRQAGDFFVEGSAPRSQRGSRARGTLLLGLLRRPFGAPRNDVKRSSNKVVNPPPAKFTYNILNNYLTNYI